MRRLSLDGVKSYAERNGLNLSEEEAAEFKILSDELLAMLEPFEHVRPPVMPQMQAIREMGSRAEESNDPYNAVVRWCRVKATEGGGLLDGKRIGVKDSMAISGVPISYGSRVLDGYIAQEDSVLVERVLRQGGEIVATLNMDALAFSGGGETSDYGHVRNPFDVSRTAAGSSGGSAVALYYDEIDITYGTDQGGSIRLPAAWAGVLGIKPTFGLVPYTGIMSLDQTFDHAGPMARTVEDLALGLQAVAGYDERDGRQMDRRECPDLLAAVANAPESLRGITVGVLKEGIGEAAGVEDATQQAHDAVVARFEELGATVREISIPEHLTTGLGLGFALFLEGQMASVRSLGNPHATFGRHSLDLAKALDRGVRKSGDDLPDSIKVGMILGSYVSELHSGTFYAKAQNMRPALRAAYDRAFEEIDVLVMPTGPVQAHEARADQSLSERVLRGWNLLGNCTPFNMSGHPSMSIPAAEAAGLPVGVMLTGPMGSDAELLSFARTYERAYGWCPELSAPVLSANGSRSV